MTYLRASRSGAARSLLVTCRGDEELEPHVTRWLTHARRLDTVRLELSGLSRDELAELAAHVLAVAPSEALVDELRSRTDGNPYLAEELIAAALSQSRAIARHRAAAPASRGTGHDPGGSHPPGQRVCPLDPRCAGGRGPADGRKSGRSGHRVWRHGSLRRRCASSPRRGCWPTGDERSELGCRPRHALLAEAISADLLADERRQLHAGVAEALESLADPALSAEIAGHWAAAGRPDDELRALMVAAESSRRVYAFSEAADLWLRAIRRAEALPDAIERLGCGSCAASAQGRRRVAGLRPRHGRQRLAEETYREYAAHTDTELAAMIRATGAVHLAQVERSRGRLGPLRGGRPPL